MNYLDFCAVRYPSVPDKEVLSLGSCTRPVGKPHGRRYRRDRKWIRQQQQQQRQEQKRRLQSQQQQQQPSSRQQRRRNHYPSTTISVTPTRFKLSQNWLHSLPNHVPAVGAWRVRTQSRLTARLNLHACLRETCRQQREYHYYYCNDDDNDNNLKVLQQAIVAQDAALAAQQAADTDWLVAALQCYIPLALWQPVGTSPCTPVPALLRDGVARRWLRTMQPLGDATNLVVHFVTDLQRRWALQHSASSDSHCYYNGDLLQETQYKIRCMQSHEVWIWKGVELKT